MAEQNVGQEEPDYDLLVVGAGAAGLAAALTAVQESAGAARVAVLERSSQDLRGGNTRWSGALLRLVGETEPVPDLAEYGVRVSGGHADREYYEALQEQIPDAFRWLLDQGVQLAQLPTMFLTLSAPRYQPVGAGKHVVDTLFAVLEQTPVTVLYETSAQHLLTSEEGRVTGVEVIGPKGWRRRITASAVVLACGGFQGSPEMMGRYVGENAHRVPPISPGGRHNTGDGLRMALEVGAATAGQFGAFHAEPKDPRSTDVAEAVVLTFPYGVVVDGHGRRVLDEGADTVDQTYEKFARMIKDLPGGIGYAVFDQKVRSIPGHERAVLTEVAPYEAATLAELEELLGIPAGALQRTVDEYNAACKGVQETFDWSRLDGLAAAPPNQPVKSNWARPLTDGPFFAYPQICANVFTFGGVKTDLDGRVVTPDGHPVPGLYGAGEMTGLYYEMYAGSTSLMRSITFGRIAARHALAASAGNGIPSAAVATSAR